MPLRPLFALLAMLSVFGLIAACSGDGAEGPTTPVVQTAPETVTETEYVEVSAVPQACVDALLNADRVIENAGQAIGLVPVLLEQIPAAYEEGYRREAGNVDGIVTIVNGVNTEVESLTEQVSVDKPAYNTAKAQCLASASSQ